MPRIRKFNRSYKFHGNRYTNKVIETNEVNRPSCSSVQTPPDTPSNVRLTTKKQSSSSKKLGKSNLPHEFVCEENNVNIIFNLDPFMHGFYVLVTLFFSNSVSRKLCFSKFVPISM